MPRELTQRSMFNPYTALVFLIGQPNECKSNPYIGTVQGIKVFSLLAEVSILERHAIERIILVQLLLVLRVRPRGGRSAWIPHIWFYLFPGIVGFAQQL